MKEGSPKEPKAGVGERRGTRPERDEAAGFEKRREMMITVRNKGGRATRAEDIWCL